MKGTTLLDTLCLRCLLLLQLTLLYLIIATQFFYKRDIFKSLKSNTRVNQIKHEGYRQMSIHTLMTLTRIINIILELA